MTRTKSKMEMIHANLLSSLKTIGTANGFLMDPRLVTDRWKYPDEYERHQYPVIVLVLDREVSRHETNLHSVSELFFDVWVFVRVEEHEVASANHQVLSAIADIKAAVLADPTAGSDENGDPLAFNVVAERTETDAGLFEPFGFGQVVLKVEYENERVIP